MNTQTTFNCWLIALGLPLASLITGCASVSTVDQQANYPEARMQIERRLHEIFVAAKNKDFERLESYHLYSPKFTRFSGSSPDRLDAAATSQLERDGLASLQNLKMQANLLKIDVFGDVGIATFILDYSFDSSGETVNGKERSTLVFVKEDGSWKITHEHLSPVTLPEQVNPADGN